MLPYFLFLSLSSGEPKLWKYDAETGAITDVATNTGLPSWSRDGKTVAWEVESSASQLWLMENFR